MLDEKERITAEWLEASGAQLQFGFWSWDGEIVYIRERVTVGWEVSIAAVLPLRWGCASRGQIDRLRRALKGEV